MGFDLCYGILFCAGEGACGPQLWSTPRRLARGRSDSVRQGLNVSCNTGEGVYIDSQIPLSSERKQNVPHSYSRAGENARFANGVRDDETKKDYINPEIDNQEIRLRFKVCRKNADTPSHGIECAGYFQGLVRRFAFQNPYQPKSMSI